MSYLIKYEDIRSARDQSAKQFNYTLEGVSQAKDSINKLLDCQNFSGQSADNIKNYFNEIHALLLSAISTCISSFSQKLLLYCDNYYSIEPNRNAIISQDTLELLVKEYGVCISKFEAATTNLGSKIKSINDIYPIQNPSVAKIIDDIHEMKTKVENYKNDVDEHERVNKELSDLESLISSLKTSISQYANKTTSEVVTYQTGDIINNQNNIELINNILAANKFSKDNSEAIKAAQDHQQEVYREIEVAEKRIQVVREVFGGAVVDKYKEKCIVTNMYSATPIVAASTVPETGAVLLSQAFTGYGTTSNAQKMSFRNGASIVGKELIELGANNCTEYLGEQLNFNEGDKSILDLFAGHKTGKN